MQVLCTYMYDKYHKYYIEGQYIEGQYIMITNLYGPILSVRFQQKALVSSMSNILTAVSYSSDHQNNDKNNFHYLYTYTSRSVHL